MSNIYYKTAEEKMMIIESLLNESKEEDLDRLMDRELQKIRLIPLDMFAAKSAINNIIEAEISRGNVNYDRSIVGLTKLDLRNVTKRNKFRFDNYYKRFFVSRSRGFDFEGLVAGLTDSKISANKNSPYDIITSDSKLVSCKTIVDNSQSIVIKSIKNKLNDYKDAFKDDLDYQKEYDAIVSSKNPLAYLANSEEPKYYEIAKKIVNEALSEIDSMIVGIPFADNKIEIYYYNKQKLIELCLNSDYLNNPKSAGAIQIRLSSRILQNPTSKGQITFPSANQGDYEEFLLGNEETKKVENLMTQFGNRYGINGFGRQLPQDIIQDLTRSNLFITDMNFILNR